MPPRIGVSTSRRKHTKCSTANVLKFLLAFTLALFAVSVFITFNLTTSVKTATNTKSIDDSRSLRKGKPREAETTTAKTYIGKAAEVSAEDASPEQVILKWAKDQRGNGKSSSLSELLSTPLHYDPGTLPLSQLKTFQRCYADPSIYSNHMQGGSTRRVPYSEKHKLALVLIPKSGSSTGRFMMKVSSS